MVQEEGGSRSAGTQQLRPAPLQVVAQDDALVGLAFAMFGLLYTYLVKRVDYLAYYWTLFLTPMFMFAGVFFPLDRLPQWVQVMAWFMPLHHGVEMMRALMVDGDPARALVHGLWLLVVCATLGWLPLVILRRRMVV